MKSRGCLKKDPDALDSVISVRLRPVMPPSAERDRDSKSMKRAFAQLIPLLEKHETWSGDQTRYIDTRRLNGQEVSTESDLRELTANQSLSKAQTVKQIETLTELEFQALNTTRNVRRSETHRNDVRDFVITIGGRWKECLFVRRLRPNFNPLQSR